MTSNRGRPTLLREPKQITINVEQSVYEALVALSKRRRLPMSELVRRAIDGWLMDQLERAAPSESQPPKSGSWKAP
jgi:hypothetical protein